MSNLFSVVQKRERWRMREEEKGKENVRKSGREGEEEGRGEGNWKTMNKEQRN